MAIRYTPQFNERMNRIVKNYNQKVTRANVRGKMTKGKLPEHITVRELKKSYWKRSDLDRELKNLEMFSRRAARRQYGSYTSGYDIDLIKANKEEAAKYFQWRSDLLAKKAVSGYPLSASRWKEYQGNADILRQDISKAAPEDLDMMSGLVKDFRQSFERRATGYRGFLSQVDALMEETGYSKEERDQFFQKFSKLTEDEFLDLYETNDLIKRIYDFADSPKLTGGVLKLNASKTEVKEKLKTLLEEQDYLIESVKRKYNL